MILPVGVESKNEIGLFNTPLSIFSCSLSMGKIVNLQPYLVFQSVSPLRPLEELNGARESLDQPEHDDGDGAEKVDELVEPQVGIVRYVSLEFDGAVGLILGQGFQDFLGSCIRVQDAPISAVPRIHPNLFIISDIVDSQISRRYHPSFGCEF